MQITLQANNVGNVTKLVMIVDVNDKIVIKESFQPNYFSAMPQNPY